MCPFAGLDVHLPPWTVLADMPSPAVLKLAQVRLPVLCLALLLDVPGSISNRGSVGTSASSAIDPRPIDGECFDCTSTLRSVLIDVVLAFCIRLVTAAPLDSAASVIGAGLISTGNALGIVSRFAGTLLDSLCVSVLGSVSSVAEDGCITFCTCGDLFDFVCPGSLATSVLDGLVLGREEALELLGSAPSSAVVSTLITLAALGLHPRPSVASRKLARLSAPDDLDWWPTAEGSSRDAAGAKGRSITAT